MITFDMLTGAVRGGERRASQVGSKALGGSGQWKAKGKKGEKALQAWDEATGYKGGCQVVGGKRRKNGRQRERQREHMFVFESDAHKICNKSIQLSSNQIGKKDLCSCSCTTDSSLSLSLHHENRETAYYCLLFY